MRKKTTKPEAQGLYQKVLARVTDQYNHRLAELLKCQGHLAELDAYLPAIEQAGVFLDRDSIYWDRHLRAVEIRVSTFLVPKSSTSTALVQLLCSLGFKATRHDTYSSGNTVDMLLTKGRLRLSLRHVPVPFTEQGLAA
jgi:hypothetical protein